MTQKKHKASETLPPAEWANPADLRPWAQNPRKNDKAVAKVAESIATFGFGAPILARRENREIIGGHTRWKAAKQLGLTRVPVRFLDLDEAKAHALALADNKTHELSKWDDAILPVVIAELQESKIDLGSAGFADHELRRILNADRHDHSSTIDSAPEKLHRKWNTALGQVWEIPSRSVVGACHRVVCGSSTEDVDVHHAVDGAADLMWTDPPYGVSYVGKTADALEIENDAQDPIALQRFLESCFSKAPLKPGSPWYIAWPPPDRFRSNSDSRLTPLVGCFDKALCG